MKILLITPSSAQVIGFRKKLIESLQNAKYDVSVLTFDDLYKDEIENRNIDFYRVQTPIFIFDTIKIYISIFYFIFI